MRKIGAKRKLIPKEHLDNLALLLQVGVPLSTAMKKKSIQASRPVVYKLLKWRKVNIDVVQASIFPPWLKEDGPIVQESPDNWCYYGFFPYGEWIKR